MIGRSKLNKRDLYITKNTYNDKQIDLDKEENLTPKSK